ncbi:hypothetical protein ACFUN8_14370 [Streptomyces sp. NPDC057307]|uniref:hypothetical protein n=1 Tax=Streptomyces sp. NPDC057307 TaxID=3346096 RepID=UPI003632F33C
MRMVARIGERVRSHVPDFLLVMRSGTVRVVNVKPASRLKDPKVTQALAWPSRLEAVVFPDLRTAFSLVGHGAAILWEWWAVVLSLLWRSWMPSVVGLLEQRELATRRRVVSAGGGEAEVAGAGVA